MDFVRVPLEGELRGYTERRVSEESLDAKLEEETQQGHLAGAEQCFRTDHHWYRLNIGYTNPLNFGEVHAELALIKTMIQERADAYETIAGKQQVFYGLGVGDTEIAFVDWALRRNDDIYITGIDVNDGFIDNFAISLRNRRFEDPHHQLHYRAYHALFQQVNAEDLAVPDRQSAHICLGGTIGNFHDQEAMFHRFSQLSKKGDSFIVGFQTDNNIETLVKKYSNNPLFNDFILNWLPKEQREEIEWSVRDNTITATHDGVEVFRTKKYDPEMLQRQIESEDFRLEYQMIGSYENSCLQFYQCE